MQRLNGVPLSPPEYHPHPRYDFSCAREKVPFFFGRDLLGICYSSALVISHRIRSGIVPKCCPKVLPRLAAAPAPDEPTRRVYLGSAIAKKTPGPRTIDAREPGDGSRFCCRYGLSLSLSLSGFSFGAGFLSVFFGGLSALDFAGAPSVAGGRVTAGFSVSAGLGVAAGGLVVAGRSLEFVSAGFGG